jgi:hypothetical protein
MVRLSTAQMQLLVNGHNSRRNTVASGNLPGFLPARRMAQMIWNNQLAEFAELNTKQCRMVRHYWWNLRTNLSFWLSRLMMHAEVFVREFWAWLRTIFDSFYLFPASFMFAGQNLAIMSTSATYTTEEVINISLNIWWDEYKNANMDNINRVGTPSANGGWATFHANHHLYLHFPGISGTLLLWRLRGTLKLVAEFPHLEPLQARGPSIPTSWLATTPLPTWSDGQSTKQVQKLRAVLVERIFSTPDCAKFRKTSIQTQIHEYSVEFFRIVMQKLIKS